MLLRAPLLLFVLFAATAARPTEYIVPPGDVSAYFADLPADATYLSFSAAAVYTASADIVLPAKQFLVIDGKGCRLDLAPQSNGFTCRIADQKEAMLRTGNRYVIRDFGLIKGGKKAIDLKASLNSTIENCRFNGQTEVAIDLSFCLMARVANVLVTNPGKKGIVLRCGDWPGATTSNSQSNHTVLDQCRVYCSRTTTDAFTVLNSGGVHMKDCISEGEEADHDLFLSATTDGNEDRMANNPVVKSFTLSNFHVEHRVRKATLYINMPSKATVDISNVYWNRKPGAPVLRYVNGQLNLSNIGWWDRGFHMETRVNAPRINIDRCHSALVVTDKAVDNKAGALHLVDPLDGHGTLQLNYVRTTRRAM